MKKRIQAVAFISAASLLLGTLPVTALAAGKTAQETLTGTAEGFGGPVTVTLTLEDGKITDCEIEAEKETPEVGGKALETLAEQVVEAGGSEIDGVSGATFTSDGVKAAVENALNPEEAPEKTALKPGTYTGTADGMNDIVEVTLEVSKDEILSAEVTYEQETAGIGAPLYTKDGDLVTNGGTAPVLLIPEQIVEHQSLAIDSVSGATVTSKAVLSAAAAALEEAGGNPAAWKTEVPVTVDGHEHQADVIVVGGGGSGLTAAITASDAGASVIVIEKTGMFGGDTVVCGAVYNSVDPEGQEKLEMDRTYVDTLEAALEEKPADSEHKAVIQQVKKDWKAFQEDGAKGMFDSSAWYALQTWNGGDKVGDLKLIEKFADNSYDGYQWLDSIGMEFQDQMGQTAGSLWQRSHFSKMKMGTGFISTYLSVLAEKEDVYLYNNLKATHLITDEDGNVIGVEAENALGETEEFLADMGVILATGGYSANAEMIQENNTSGKWGDLSGLPTTNRHACSQGDGIAMVQEIGGGTRDLDQLQLLYLGNMKDGGLSKYPARCNTATTETIFVNQEGERFVREDGRRDEICAAVLEQTGQYYYIIESADGSQYTDINDPEWRSADGFTREYLEENGYIWVADTLEELAEMIDVPADALQASVDSYNECYDNDEDPEFGRTAFAARLEHGPYTATIRQASVHHTMGGVTIDTDARVLDKEGEVIDGLYACGEVVGGVHGGNRLGGNAVTDTVVFGRIAGGSIVADQESAEEAEEQDSEEKAEDTKGGR